MENKAFLENLGWQGKLSILPFDHRSYFEQLLGFTEPLTDNQSTELTHYKNIVYHGYERSLSLGISKTESAILVDDVFGLDILMDAKAKGYVVLQSTEKSGDDHFEFQHGDSENADSADDKGDKDDWKSWIEKVRPTFVKALVRYNPDDHQDLNRLSLTGLKELSDYAHANGYKFLIEPLVPASAEQLSSIGPIESPKTKHRYDTELRPDLTARMITEMQDAGIEPDIWKIEGMFEAAHYEKVVAAARRTASTGPDRSHVGVISLGRNETDEVVETWLRVGSQVPGVIGFAVGRTVFLQALLKFRSGEYTEDQAVQEIAERFVHFSHVFNG